MARKSLDAKIQEWTDYLPTLLDAIGDGELDQHLATIAVAAKNRFMELNPGFVPGQAKPTADPVTAVPGDYNYLGENGNVVPIAMRGVSTNPGTRYFTVNGNAYLRSKLEGKYFRFTHNSNFSNLGSVPEGTVVEVISIARKNFVVRIVSSNKTSIVGSELGMRFEYNMRLLEQ